MSMRRLSGVAVIVAASLGEASVAHATQPQIAVENPVPEGAEVPNDVLAFPFYCAAGDPSVVARDAGGGATAPRLLSEIGEEIPTTLVPTGRPRGTSPPEVQHELRFGAPLVPGAYRLEFHDCDGQRAVRRFRAVAAAPRSSVPAILTSTARFVPAASGYARACSAAGSGDHTELVFAGKLDPSWQPYGPHLEIALDDGPRRPALVTPQGTLVAASLVNCCGTTDTRGDYGSAPGRHALSARVYVRGHDDGVALAPVSGTLDACSGSARGASGDDGSGAADAACAIASDGARPRASTSALVLVAAAAAAAALARRASRRARSTRTRGA